jgi:hypothetical protein
MSGHHWVTPTVILESQVHRIQVQGWRGHIPGHSDGEVTLLGTV